MPETSLELGALTSSFLLPSTFEFGEVPSLDNSATAHAHPPGGSRSGTAICFHRHVHGPRIQYHLPARYRLANPLRTPVAGPNDNLLELNLTAETPGAVDERPGHQRPGRGHHPGTDGLHPARHHHLRPGHVADDQWPAHDPPVSITPASGRFPGQDVSDPPRSGHTSQSRRSYRAIPSPSRHQHGLNPKTTKPALGPGSAGVC
jgi:hypothetical protein